MLGGKVRHSIPSEDALCCVLVLFRATKDRARLLDRFHRSDSGRAALSDFVSHRGRNHSCSLLRDWRGSRRGGCFHSRGEVTSFHCHVRCQIGNVPCDP